MCPGRGDGATPLPCPHEDPCPLPRPGLHAQLQRAGSPQCRSSEPSLQSSCPSHSGLGFFTQLRSSHWKVNVPQGTPGMEGTRQATEGGSLSPEGAFQSETRKKMAPGEARRLGRGLSHTKGFPRSSLGSLPTLMQPGPIDSEAVFPLRLELLDLTLP